MQDENQFVKKLKVSSENESSESEENQSKAEMLKEKIKKTESHDGSKNDSDYEMKLQIDDKSDDEVENKNEIATVSTMF